MSQRAGYRRLREYSSSIEARAAAAFLNAHGIEASLSDELAADLLPNSGTMNVSLWVADDDLQQATSLLSDRDVRVDRSPPSTVVQSGGRFNNPFVHTVIRFVLFSGLLVLLIIILGIIVTAVADFFEPSNYGHTFSNRRFLAAFVAGSALILATSSRLRKIAWAVVPAVILFFLVLSLRVRFEPPQAPTVSVPSGDAGKWP